MHGAQPVGDYEGGAPAHDGLHRLADLLLRAGVDAGGRVVQHQHRRVQQHCAGDGQALALAAGKRGASLSDHGLVALVQALDVVVELGDPCRLLHLLHRGPLPTVGDVVPDGTGEEEHVLLHDPDVAAKGGQRGVSNVHAVDGHAARVHVVEPG